MRLSHFHHLFRLYMHVLVYIICTVSIDTTILFISFSTLYPASRMKNLFETQPRKKKIKSNLLCAVVGDIPIIHVSIFFFFIPSTHLLYLKAPWPVSQQIQHRMQSRKKSIMLRLHAFNV